MAVPRLAKSRQKERNKVTLAEKYKKQGAATGGGRMNAKKVRRAAQKKSVPIRQKAAGKTKAKPGRRRTPAHV